MYGNTSAGVGVGGVLLCGSFYMCLTVECVLCSENVYTAHCMKQCAVQMVKSSVNLFTLCSTE